MKNLKITLLTLSFAILSINLTACGQKGPLIVEPAPVVQVEILDEDGNTTESETIDSASDDE